MDHAPGPITWGCTACGDETIECALGWSPPRPCTCGRYAWRPVVPLTLPAPRSVGARQLTWACLTCRDRTITAPFGEVPGPCTCGAENWKRIPSQRDAAQLLNVAPPAVVLGCTQRAVLPAHRPAPPAEVLTAQHLPPPQGSPVQIPPLRCGHPPYWCIKCYAVAYCATCGVCEKNNCGRQAPDDGRLMEQDICFRNAHTRNAALVAPSVSGCAVIKLDCYIGNEAVASISFHSDGMVVAKSHSGISRRSPGCGTCMQKIAKAIEGTTPPVTKIRWIGLACDPSYSYDFADHGKVMAILSSRLSCNNIDHSRWVFSRGGVRDLIVTGTVDDVLALYADDIKEVKKPEKPDRESGGWFSSWF